MKKPTEKRPTGRPRSENPNDQEIHAYVNVELMRLFRALQASWGSEGTSATVRRMIREAAKREGIR